jgi:hypothetical protein
MCFEEILALSQKKIRMARGAPIGRLFKSQKKGCRKTSVLQQPEQTAFS